MMMMMMMMIDRPLSIITSYTLGPGYHIVLSCVVGIISPTDLFGGFFLFMVP